MDHDFVSFIRSGNFNDALLEKNQNDAFLETNENDAYCDQTEVLIKSCPYGA